MYFLPRTVALSPSIGAGIPSGKKSGFTIWCISNCNSLFFLCGRCRRHISDPKTAVFIVINPMTYRSRCWCHGRSRFRCIRCVIWNFNFRSYFWTNCRCHCRRNNRCFIRVRIRSYDCRSTQGSGMCLNGETILGFGCICPSFSICGIKTLICINTGNCCKPGTAAACFFQIISLRTVRNLKNNRVESSRWNLHRLLKPNGLDSGKGLRIFHWCGISRSAACRIRRIRQIGINLNLKISIILWNCSNDLTELFIFSFSGGCLKNIGSIVSIGNTWKDNGSCGSTIIKIIIIIFF